MFASMSSFLATLVYGILTAGGVLLATILLAKATLTWLAWKRSKHTHGAWFRLSTPALYAAALASAALVGVATWFLLDTHRRWAVTLIVLAQAVAFGWARSGWVDTKKRIAMLVSKDADPPSPPPVQVAPGGKTIVIFCDGTGNTADAIDARGRPALTNVSKLYNALTERAASGWTQVKWYDPGVGTFSSRRAGWLARLSRILGKLAAALPAEVSGIVTRVNNLLELATGMGILENITEGYVEIVKQYEPGDRIAILGFSRGAYTARTIAGVIARCGLVRREYARFAPDVVQLYRYRQSPASDVWIKREMRYSRSEVPVHFLGLWDTVASLGAPLWGWWFTVGSMWSNKAFDTSPAAICLNVHHALSIDERRSQFFPTLFEEPEPEKDAKVKTRITSRGFEQKVEQAWFRGAHADVGGGYAECGLSDVGLAWMVDRAKAAGLKFDDQKLAVIAPQELGDMHDEMARVPGWKYFGSWPRWHPCPRIESNVSDGYGFLDESVYRRGDHARTRRADRAALLAVAASDLALGEDELCFLDPGQRARVRVDANRVWNRSGLVLENGGRYRIAAVPGGSWRDKECDASDAGGQSASRHHDLRARFGWGKRLPSAHWMALVGTLAHPRSWPLQEKTARELVRYLLREDPEELRSMLLPLESASRRPVDVEVRAMSGMLHCFANDLWAFYDNNSGVIELDVTRLADDAPAPWRPDYVIGADGRVAAAPRGDGAGPAAVA